MSFLFEGSKGFILLNDNKVIRLDEKRKCCVTKVIRFEMVVERKVLINIVGRGFVWAKGFREKKEKSFRTKGERGENTRRGMPTIFSFGLKRFSRSLKEGECGS